MPYIPPSGTLDPEITCALVFFPNAEEYQRALFGQLAQLTDVWTWETDRESQAIIRQVWLDAEKQTLECFDMACLDDILTAIGEINAKLPWCCDVDVLIHPINDGAGGTDVWIVDGPGPAPLPIPDNDTGAGEYPITPGTDPDEGGTVSQAEWEEYACGAANFVIDSLIDWLRFTLFLVNTQQLGIRAVQWLATRIVGYLIPGVIDDFALYELDDLQGEFYSIIPDLQASQLETAISQLENIREQLACVIVGENTAANAIGALLNLISGEISNATILAFISSPVAILASLIWNGAFDTSWDDGCGCTTEVITSAGIRMRLNSWTGTNIGGETTGGQVQIRVGGGGTWFPFHSTPEVGSVAGNYDLIWNRATSQAALDTYEDDFEDINFLSGQLLEIRLANTSGVVRNVGVNVTLLSAWDGSSWRPIVGTDIISGSNLTGTTFDVPAGNISVAGATGYTSFNVRGFV